MEGICIRYVEVYFWVRNKIVFISSLVLGVEMRWEFEGKWNRGNGGIVHVEKNELFIPIYFIDVCLFCNLKVDKHAFPPMADLNKVKW